MSILVVRWRAISFKSLRFVKDGRLRGYIVQFLLRAPESMTEMSQALVDWDT
jgi:hypothetical protein